MASFCYDAYEELFGDGMLNDFGGAPDEPDYRRVLCEGARPACEGGYHWVDADGRRVPEDVAVAETERRIEAYKKGYLPRE